ncbi:BRO-N domain-containing protein [Variovorax sp. PBL-E5]|uniref:BRO-N domain-containing protein n=1 Tax=Variovorax sp. PBL-E5 TaxID=434014 RepID=UPI001318FFAB|nr:BRO family protein [Variovorax sp. PBL-E5]VTU37149.1 putative phage-encoded protein [Variovorax sp. PBL-E5]
MSNVIPFDFEGSSIRLLDLEGSPWFVAMEIAAVLDYSDAFEMTKRLDDDEKQNRQIAGLGSPSGGRGITLINESGLYSAILGSRKPEAAKFKKWVTAEVLPSIRKTGSYTAPKAAPSPVRLAYDAAKAFPPLFRVARLLGCDKNAAAISANQMVRQLTDVNLMAGLGQIHLVAEKQDTQFFTPTELGKRISTSARGVNLLLAESGMQMKCGDTWEATEAGMEFCRIYDTGKRHGSGVPVQQIKWSPSVLPLLGCEKEAA